MGDEWKRAIVRIWHYSFGGKKFLGTGSLIAPGYVLTAKHVLQNTKKIYFSNLEIILTSDTGAFEDGGERRIEAFNRQALMHPEMDVIVLPLVTLEPGATPITLASRDDLKKLELPTVTIAGFSQPNGNLEAPEIKITGFLGKQNTYVAHTAIAKGFSGGPVLFEQKLIGIAYAKDDAHTYITPLHSFYDFIEGYVETNNNYIHLRTITPLELTELKKIVQHFRISNEKALFYFSKVVPDSIQKPPEDCHDGIDLFSCCLELLADKKYEPPDQAPLLEFLEYCHPQFKANFHPKLIDELTVWKNKVTQRLEIKLETIREKINKKNPISDEEPPVLLVKIEPKVETDDQFLVKAWMYRDGAFKPENIQEKAYNRKGLEDLLKTFIPQAIRPINAHATTRNLIIELVLPQELFDWNPNEINLKFGAIERMLGTVYPVIIRSFDRIYDINYSIVIPEWITHWQTCCNLEVLQDEHIYDVDESCCVKNLVKELNKLEILLTLFPAISQVDKLKELLGVAISMGLPFALWPLRQQEDCAQLRAEIYRLFCCQKIPKWLTELRDYRKTKSSCWNNFSLLWDNPERLPPDAPCEQNDL